MSESVTPKVAQRLCALGELLMRGPQRYSVLSQNVRGFITQVTGPNPQLAQSPLELLRFDGLVEDIGSGDHRGIGHGGDGHGGDGNGGDGNGGDGDTADEALFQVTAEGRDAFRNLMMQGKAATSEITRLMMMMRLRFLHLLPTDDQAALLQSLIQQFDLEGQRLQALRDYIGDEPGSLPGWLDHYIGQQRDRMRWLRTLQPEGV